MNRSLGVISFKAVLNAPSSSKFPDMLEFYISEDDTPEMIANYMESFTRILQHYLKTGEKV